MPPPYEHYGARLLASVLGPSVQNFPRPFPVADVSLTHNLSEVALLKMRRASYFRQLYINRLNPSDAKLSSPGASV